MDTGANTPFNHLLAVLAGCGSPSQQQAAGLDLAADVNTKAWGELAARMDAWPTEDLIGYIFERWNGFKLSHAEVLKICRMLPKKQIVRLALAIRMRQATPDLVLSSVYSAYLEPYKAPMKPARAPSVKPAKV